MNTINYYNQHAEQFAESTFNVDMESLYQPFLAHLSVGARILDVGCGSGRDSLAFKNKGYEVEAIDYSEAMVQKAKELTGIEVKHQSFYDLEQVECFEGIWACASLLHCERRRLVNVIQKMLRALKVNGVIYLSFKYGDSDREKEGRYFTDLNEQQLAELLEQLEQVELLKQWITVDQRPDRSEGWLNVLLKKTV